MPNVVLVTNIPAPYRIPIFNLLGKSREINFTVIYCAEREPDRQWDLAQHESSVVFLKEQFKLRDGRYVHNNPDVWRHLRELNPDVVITPGFNPTFLYAFCYAMLFRKKHIAMSDGTLASEAGLSWRHRLARRIVYRFSSAFIGASQATFELFRAYGIAGEKLFQSHLSIDNGRFADRRDGAKEFDLMFCGTFTERKQPLFAVCVAEALARKLGREVSLLLVGSGELEGALRRQLAETPNVRGVIHGFAKQAELPALYGCAKLFLFPTRQDPWGIVVNEACAAGLPVITTPEAGTAGEIVVDQQNGYVRAAVAEEWASLAAGLLTDPERYAQFSHRSAELVAGHTFRAAADGILGAVCSAMQLGSEARAFSSTQ
jgi:glycosyltransferase involved in cell wall biosynthesis